MGLDVGDRTLGVAFSDELWVTAQGWGVLRRTTRDRDVKAVVALAGERRAGRIVVGLPRSLDGGIGPQAEKVLAFVKALREASPIPVELWDERLTTRIAQHALRTAGTSRARRKLLVDQVAAAVILQGFLDFRRGHADGPGHEAGGAGSDGGGV
jgi:putative Holliday junction resolvase